MALAKHHPIWREALLPAFTMSAEVVCLALAWMVANFLQWRQVLVLEAAMPAATLSAVFAQR